MTAEPPKSIRIFGRDLPLPGSRRKRVAVGVGLVIGGILGFLPVLGFWMAPLGLLILSHEYSAVRRARRRLVVWWERRRNGRKRRG